MSRTTTMEIDQQRLHPDAAFCRAGKDSARQSLDETLQYVAELVLIGTNSSDRWTLDSDIHGRSLVNREVRLQSSDTPSRHNAST